MNSHSVSCSSSTSSSGHRLKNFYSQNAQVLGEASDILTELFQVFSPFLTTCFTYMNALPGSPGMEAYRCCHLTLSALLVVSRPWNSKKLE